MKTAISANHGMGWGLAWLEMGKRRHVYMAIKCSCEYLAS